jgi:hypothetical protein
MFVATVAAVLSMVRLKLALNVAKFVTTVSSLSLSWMTTFVEFVFASALTAIVIRAAFAPAQSRFAVRAVVAAVIGANSTLSVPSCATFIYNISKRA